MQQNVLNAARTETSYDFTPMFEYIGDVVGNADWTVGDVEGPMDNRPDSAYSGYRSLQYARRRSCWR